jgi:hypothetical protein
MCRISRHTTSLLSGIASLECRVVELQIKVLDHCSSAPRFWPCCTDVPAQTSEQNPIEPSAFLKRITCWTTLVFKVQSTSVWIFGENLVWKWLNETVLESRRSRARRRRAPPRRPRRTRLAHTRRGTGKPSGPRPAPVTLCTRGRDACVEA